MSIVFVFLFSVEAIKFEPFPCRPFLQQTTFENIVVKGDIAQFHSIIILSSKESSLIFEKCFHSSPAEV